MENSTPTEAARQYLARGWQPLPLKPNSKRPAFSHWPKLRWTGPDDEAIEGSWEAGQGVGLILGAPSGGLVDMDLDAHEARALAKAGLRAPTRMVSGRGAGSEAYSHLWYIDAQATTEKLLDPIMQAGDPDRATMVEVRSTGAQTAVHPTIHPSGQSYEWLVLEEPGVNHGETNQDARDLAAVSLLLRYWPTRGVRHEAYLALVGALLTLNMPDGQINPHWRGLIGNVVTVLGHLSGDEEAWSRAHESIPSTIEAIASGRNVTGFRRLAELFEATGEGTAQAVWRAKEWFSTRTTDPESTELEDALDAIEDDPFTEDPDAEVWEWVDVAGALEEGPKEVPELIPGLIYAEQVHLIMGYGGGGKSLLCLDLMRQLMASGLTVAYLDWQNGLPELVRRLGSFGVTTEELSRLRYVDFPTVGLATRAEASVNQLLREEVSVVFVDSMSDAIQQESDPENPKATLSENDNDGVGWFLRTGIDAMRRAGITVIIIDHLGKADASRARGAVIKDDLVQLTYSVRVLKRWNARKAGAFRISSRKTRISNVPDAVDVTVTPASASTPLTMEYTLVWDKEAEDEEPARMEKAPKGFTLEADDLGKRVVTALAEGEMDSQQLFAVVGGNRNELFGWLLEVRKGHEVIRWRKDGRSFFYYLDK